MDENKRDAAMDEVRDQFADAFDYTKKVPLEEWAREHYRSLHAAQAAVALLVARQLEGAPEAFISRVKHLRVGINNAMADHGALTFLLMEKGIITDEEYRAALLTFARREAADRANETRRELRLPDTVTFA